MAKKGLSKSSHRSDDQKAAGRERRSAIASEVARMAKTANQRLREIEKQGLQSPSHAYRYVERLYADQDTATDVDSRGRFKWSTNTSKKTYQELQHEKAELERFLYQSHTSTVAGTRAQYSKGYQTYKNKMSGSGRVPMSEQQYGDMWRAWNMKDKKSHYGSSQIIDIYEAGVEQGMTIDEITNMLDDMPPDATITEIYDEMGADPFGWMDAGDWDPFET